MYAISRLLGERRGGIFNLTADGTIKLSEAARIAGVKVRKMPLSVYRRIAAAAWRLRLPNVEAPPGQIDFLLLPVDRVERQDQGGARLDAALHEPRDVRADDAREGQGRRRRRGTTRRRPVPAPAPPAPVA